MKEKKIYKFAKLFICVFLAYVMWFKYAYREYSIILYGSVIAAAFIMLIDILMNHDDVLSVCPYGVLINLFMCFYSIAFGYFVARNQYALVSAVKTYFAFSVVCIVVCYISKAENGIEWLANVLISIYLICAVYVIFKGYHIRGYGNVLGKDQNPNNLALNMNIGLFCLAYKSRVKQNRSLRYFLLAIVFLYIIIGCGSRKSLIAAVIICGLWIFPYIKQVWINGHKNDKIAIMFFLIVMMAGVCYYYTNIYINTYSYQRMQNLGSNEEGSSALRMLYYRYAINYFMEKPMFGIGLAQFTYWNPLHTYSHSTYAEAIAVWGFVGTCIYFFPVINAGKQIIKTAIINNDNHLSRIILALLIMELFLGIGQIWFYEIEHLLIWTMIFLYLHIINQNKTITKEKVYKYVKD